MNTGPPSETDLWQRARALPDVAEEGLGFRRRFETSGPDAEPGLATTGAPAAAPPEGPPTGDQPTEAQPPPPDAQPTRSRRRWPRRVALGTLAVFLLVALAVGGLAGYGLWRLSSIERVPLDHVLSPAEGSARNYLVVGSDSREGLAADEPNAGYLLGEGVPVGSYRSDTILIMRIDGGTTSLLSIPRDLWVQVDGTGGRQRINTAFAGGPERVIRTVQRSLGVPVHHYMEIDFVAFAGIVDALGGVTIDVAHPASDPGSGLTIPGPGPVRMDGSQALAFVRSRHYTELINGQQVVDGTGDLGRVQRQQAFLSAVLSELGHQWNPFKVNSVASAAASGLTVDDRLSAWDLARLGLKLRGSAPAGTSVPVYPYTTDGGASVLGLTDDADTVLTRFR